MKFSSCTRSPNLRNLIDIYLFDNPLPSIWCISRPTLFIGKNQGGLYALPAMVDEKSVIVDVSRIS